MVTEIRRVYSMTGGLYLLYLGGPLRLPLRPPLDVKKFLYQ